ncbi:hypothetical protein [Pantoea sp. BAV 3049]|uniref:hypothetical protein n=1 Tax=Pantoea sp. BAV 3049 TaxID=2654188 RepID=UPI00131D83BD|nr:hypothetical protein [Pantoea sp. BAV 3049]
MIFDDLFLPVLPQAFSENEILLSDIELGGGVFVGITEYQRVNNSDEIEVYWDGIKVFEYYITIVEGAFPLSLIIKTNVGLGKHELYYTVTDIAKNKQKSQEIVVTVIDGDVDDNYPAPIFTDAVNDIISWSSIKENKGTHLYIAPYKDITLGDIVTIFLTKKGASTYSKYSIVLISDENISAGINYVIDYEFLMSGGDGEILAYYQVQNSKQIYKGHSKNSSAEIKNTNDQELSITVTQGAANTDYAAINLYPFNYGVIRGQAGESVTLAVSEPTLFSPSGLSVINDKLDEEGLLYFKIYSTSQGVSEITAYNNSTKSVSEESVFGPYSKGNGKLKSINYSTLAPDNGVTPCSIYLKTDNDAAITKVRVRLLNGSAVISGYGTSTADILLNPDFSAEIDIVNKVSEIVNIELSLPEASGSITYVSCSFVAY